MSKSDTNRNHAFVSDELQKEWDWETPMAVKPTKPKMLKAPSLLLTQTLESKQLSHGRISCFSLHRSCFTTNIILHITLSLNVIVTCVQFFNSF